VIIEQGFLRPVLHREDSVQAAVERARNHGDVAWIVLQAPSAAEFCEILDTLGRSDHTALAIHRRVGRVAWMLVDSVVLITISDLERSRLGRFVGLQLVVSREFVVCVVHDMTAEELDSMRHGAECLLGGPNQPHGVTGWTFLASLVAVMFERYERILDDLDDSIAQVAATAFPDPPDDLVERIHTTAQRVLLATRVLRPLERALSALPSHLERLAVGDDEMKMVVRLRSDARDLVERATWMREMLTSLTQAVFGLLWRKANDLTGEQTDAATRLGAYAALLAVPAVIFGIYGTNFRDQPWLERQWWGYPLVLAVTLLIEILLWRRCKQRGWL
jgi:Mg2+ and Co2+ transporter CorA